VCDVQHEAVETAVGAVAVIARGEAGVVGESVERMVRVATMVAAGLRIALNERGCVAEGNAPACRAAKASSSRPSATRASGRKIAWREPSDIRCVRGR
jgi:hypothetical protein